MFDIIAATIGIAIEYNYYLMIITMNRLIE